MSLNLRYMQLSDIRHVAAIDDMCFEPPWTRDSYAFEINESRVSHMVVLDQQPNEAQPAPERPHTLLTRVRGRLSRNLRTAERTGTILGFGGLWKIEGEAHISTIAIHPSNRGQGYGEILLAGMLGKALQLNAEYVVLEVRVSNSVAQSLYLKYGFNRVARKKNYYRSDSEDAWDMRVSLDHTTKLRFQRLYEKLRIQHDFRDAYSRSAHPRR